MKHFQESGYGKVSMDYKVKYGCSIKQFENQKRSLRRSDKDDERIRIARQALREQLRKSL